MSKVKAHELDQKVKRYILECVDGTDYDVELKTMDEKIRFLESCFLSEYGFAIEQYGRAKALKEWFSGLPSCCTVAFYNAEILNIAVEWGSLPENPKPWQETKILDNWFNLIAVKTGQLFDGYRLPKE